MTETVQRYNVYECPHCGYRITLRAAIAIEEFNIEGFEVCPRCSTGKVDDYTPRIIKEKYDTESGRTVTIDEQEAT